MRSVAGLLSAPGHTSACTQGIGEGDGGRREVRSQWPSFEGRAELKCVQAVRAGKVHPSASRNSPTCDTEILIALR